MLARAARAETVNEHQDEAEWNVAEWRGKLLVDLNGAKIGKLQDSLRRR